MKSELKKNMYVRTKNGLIAKYIGYRTDKDIKYNKYLFDGKIYWYYEYYNDYVYEEDFKKWFEERVIKTSYNIIDLIEVGDYVNGFPVIHKENDILKCGLLVQFKENEIKSIVTKEQFESMKYKLGDDK